MKVKYSTDGRLWCGLNDKNGTPIYQGDCIRMRIDLDEWYDYGDGEIKVSLHGFYTGEAILLPSMGAVIKNVVYVRDGDLHMKKYVSGYKNIRAYRSEVTDATQ